MWAQGAEQPAGGASLLPSAHWHGFRCPLEPSGAVSAVDKCDLICRFDPPCLVFWNNSAESIDSPKLVEIISLNP